MFKHEIGIIGRIDTLVDRLNDVTEDLWSDAQDLDTNVNDSLRNEDMLAWPYNVDWIFRDMVTSERDIAASLTKFDRVLNQLIAERIKLGDFTLTRK